MDIALAVEQIYEAAIFAKSDTYANLVKSWRDIRKVPSEEQLGTAWLQILGIRAEQALEKEVLEQRKLLASNILERDKLTLEERVDLLFHLVLDLYNPV